MWEEEYKETQRRIVKGQTCNLEEQSSDRKIELQFSFSHHIPLENVTVAVYCGEHHRDTLILQLKPHSVKQKQGQSYQLLSETVFLPYKFEVRQRIWLILTDRLSQSLHSRSEQVDLNQLACNISLGTIRPLQDKQDKIIGYVKIRCKQLQAPKEAIILQFRTKRVESEGGCLCFCQKEDIYFTISKQTSKGRKIIAQQSNPANSNGHIFPKLTIKSAQLCDSKPNQSFFVEFFNYTSKNFIGKAIITLLSLREGKQHYVIEGNNEETKGQLQILYFQSRQLYSITDYVQNGMDFALKIGIDFSQSNLNHTNNTSLHYFDAHTKSSYQKILEQCTRLFFAYQPNSQVPAYGFGAKVGMRGFNPALVSDYFPLNGCLQKPEVSGLKGILRQYRDAIPFLTFAGPVHLSPAIKYSIEQARLMKQQGRYMLLLLVTSGAIADIQLLLSLAAESARLPISILVVSIFNQTSACNKEMLKLLDAHNQRMDTDSNHKVNNKLTFVQYKVNYDSLPELMEKALRKISREVVAFHQHEKIVPGAYNKFNEAKTAERRRSLQQLEHQLDKQIIMAQRRSGSSEKQSEGQEQTKQIKRYSSDNQRREKGGNEKREIQRISRKEQGKANDNECPICLDRQADVMTICKHRFCKLCMERTLKIKNYCPLCRHFNPMQQDSDQKEEQIHEAEWNLAVARRVIYQDVDQNTRQIYLQQEDGNREATNVFVSKNAKIQCSPNANIFINGKRVNPNECNQQ